MYHHQYIVVSAGLCTRGNTKKKDVAQALYLNPLESWSYKGSLCNQR